MIVVFACEWKKWDIQVSETKTAGSHVIKLVANNAVGSVESSFIYTSE